VVLLANDRPGVGIDLSARNVLMALYGNPMYGLQVDPVSGAGRNGHFFYGRRVLATNRLFVAKTPPERPYLRVSRPSEAPAAVPHLCCESSGITSTVRGAWEPWCPQFERHKVAPDSQLLG
jgi:hypothetical protein